MHFQNRKKKTSQKNESVSYMKTKGATSLKWKKKLKKMKNEFNARTFHSWKKNNTIIHEKNIAWHIASSISI